MPAIPDQFIWLVLQERIGPDSEALKEEDKTGVPVSGLEAQVLGLKEALAIARLRLAISGEGDLPQRFKV